MQGESIVRWYRRYVAIIGGRSPEEPGGMDGGVVPRRAHGGADTRRRPTPKYDGQRVGIAPWVLRGPSIRCRSGVVRPLDLREGPWQLESDGGGPAMPGPPIL